ncbi:M4 family metallopeptidase [Nocardioides ferulae]|uniref:M4 family metallopeptidase n=1 Tax=Nocardioides ferulae TaxID=2340821 RepID=UPI000F890903|nr:M4 family metallopeptidase [Nocardioides ferulae]
MRNLKTGLTSLALLGAGLAAVPGMSAQAAPAAPTPGESLVQQMRGEAKGGVAVTKERATGKVGFVRAGRGGDLMPSEGGASAQGAAEKADAYLDKYAAAFGASAAQLRQTGVRADQYGWTVSFAQDYQGVPVFGAELRAHVDRQGDLTAVNGYAAPALDLSVSPRLSEGEAGERAVSLVRADRPGAEGEADVSGIEAKDAQLVVYRHGVTRGEPGKAVLAYQVEVSNDANVREMVFLDANSGKPVNRYSMIAHDLEREVYEATVNNGGTPDDPADDSVFLDLIWEERDAFPGDLDEDQQRLVEGTGESYWFFFNSFGRDSYDAQGAPMRTVNNDPRISCPNANWNGQTTNYCTDVTSDDTVAHEWAHAYTEYTSGLIYQWQPGAMNESFSDIWGETVDMLNGRQDENSENNQAPRPVGLCSQYTRGHVGLTINSPESVAGPCEAAPASFGPTFTKEGVTADVVVAKDASGEGDTDTNGCDDFTNAADIAGKWAYVDRGVCTFASKAENAEEAGATGIVIGNNDPEAPEPFSISGTADIYGVMVSTSDAAKFREAGTLNVTVKDIDEDEKVDSHRWLSGENDRAFGGAIRDMWNPTCYGDPGKVSDAEYKCSTDDQGGVHSNSGVPNHAYSLLVDGGDYNGQSVPGIGLTKAAHLFWRTQANYLTPTSDFTDLADGLAASCAELTGQAINELSVATSDQRPSDEVISGEDCAAVSAMTAAVELRRAPEQCDFEPLLAKGAPGACGKGTRTRTVFKEGFGKGLKGWKRSSTVVYDGGRSFPWRATAQAPATGSKVAYAPAPDAGDCSTGPNDISSSNGLISPRVKVPGGVGRFLEFRHYVATEAGYDGGTVMVKVNKGKWKVVPAGAYEFNEPGQIASAAEGNTNPLAGEPGFTGTDGGVVTGSWGTSIVNLKKVGVNAGDKVRVRFEMGRDGCGGIDGWYVDDVKVVVCKAGKGRAAVAGRENG